MKLEKIEIFRSDQGRMVGRKENGDWAHVNISWEEMHGLSDMAYKLEEAYKTWRGERDEKSSDS